MNGYQQNHHHNSQEHMVTLTTIRRWFFKEMLRHDDRYVKMTSEGLAFGHRCETFDQLNIIWCNILNY